MFNRRLKFDSYVHVGEYAIVGIKSYKSILNNHHKGGALLGEKSNVTSELFVIRS